MAGEEAYTIESRTGLGVFARPWTWPWRNTAARLWERAELKQLLATGETILWADFALTGILGHPWVTQMPFLWGSSFWDVAITNRRLLAVHCPIVTFRKRTWKTYSIPWAEVTRAQLQPSGIASLVLTVEALSMKKRFKLVGRLFKRNEAVEAIRKVYADVVMKTGLL